MELLTKIIHLGSSFITQPAISVAARHSQHKYKHKNSHAAKNTEAETQLHVCRARSKFTEK